MRNAMKIKEEKKRWLHFYNRILSGVLVLLGFNACDGTGADEYGTPYCRFEIKGKVLDELDSTLWRSPSARRRRCSVRPLRSSGGRKPKRPENRTRRRTKGTAAKSLPSLLRRRGAAHSASVSRWTASFMVDTKKKSLP